MRNFEHAILVGGWLLLFKILYLGMVCGALWTHSDFDEEKAGQIDASWFSGSASAWKTEHKGRFARHFATWDAQHYLFLSEAGYSAGAKSCAFYPLWPLTIHWFSVFTGGNHWIAGMLLANSFSLAGWMIFYHLSARRFGKNVALLALVLMIVFPGSLFFQFIYSESLFFLLLMLLWLGLERHLFKLALAAAFLLPLSRAVGVFTLLPIAWHWLMRQPWQWLERWQWFKIERQRLTLSLSPSEAGGDHACGNTWRAALLLAAPLLGWSAYLGLMWLWTGNPFEGMLAQKYWGVHSISNLWNVPRFVLGFTQPTTWHDFSGSVLDRYFFLLLLYSLPVIWRLGKDQLIWTYALGILPAMSGTFTSFTRFESCVFPCFIAVAFFFSGLKRKWPLVLLVLCSLALHLVLLWRFVNFRWAG